MGKDFHLNSIINRFGFNKRKKVGDITELISRAMPLHLQEWEEFYYKNGRSKEVIENMTRGQGLQILYACLPIAFAGLVSAIHQGKVCAAGVGLTAKQPSESGKALVFGVFVEFYAVLGLIVTIFLLQAVTNSIMASIIPA